MGRVSISLYPFKSAMPIRLNNHTVDCGGLSGPSSGQVKLTGRLLGSEATYTCDPGYILVGNHTRECLSSGRWSDEDPYCVLENLKAIIGAVVSVSVVLLFIGLILVVFAVIYHKRKSHFHPSTNDLAKFSNNR